MVAGPDQLIGHLLLLWRQSGVERLEGSMPRARPSRMVEVKGASHSVHESRTKEIAAFIEEAAQHAQDQ